MPKRISVILLIFVLLIILFVPCVASGATISVGSAGCMPGEIVTVSVSISGNPEINTFSLEFPYDEQKMT